MAAGINIPVYSDALVVLATAGVVVPLARRLGVSPVLAYLTAGAVLGPLGLGSLIDLASPLYWLTVTDANHVSGIAELGVVFLLFLIGLELSFSRLKTMRKLVFGLGMAQVAVSTALIASIARFFGLEAGPALMIGASLALSSTAIVVELLSGQGRMRTGSGRAAFAILLAQDLAVIPLLLLVSVLSGSAGSSLITGLGIALAQAAIALAAILLFGRFMLRPIFRLVASTQSTELFIAATLFVIVLSGVLAAVAGMSMALGAFVAGLILAETEFRKSVEAVIEPFKSLLLGIFFFTIGMGIDIREILREPLWLVAGIAALIAGKAAATYGLARLFGIARPAAAEAALLIGPGGEFAFVGIGAAMADGVIAKGPGGFALALAALSMALIPAMSAFGRRLEKRLSPPRAGDDALAARPEGQRGHAILVGHGRVGKVVGAMLDRHATPYLASDTDALAVGRDRRAGLPVYYGDATDPLFLDACGLAEASAVIITIHTPEAIDRVVELVRARRPDIPIVSRARDGVHACHLYRVGVTDAVPETIEASLQLSEAALVNLNVPMGKVIASIHEMRDEFRAELLDAAAPQGRDRVHGVRAKSGAGE